MHLNTSILSAAALFCVLYGICSSQNSARGVPRTRFTCVGRPSGYYADVETGCQVYHMCDGLGRQFSYTCPNTTLFQQRMLICDHWYMVNCSRSESDYSANLLIGQRDKPFVSDAEMQLRTPRPDILSVPPNSNYFDGLKEAESKFPVHPDNHIVGIGDAISNENNNGLDSGKHHYRPPSSWSTGTATKNNFSSRPNTDRTPGTAQQDFHESDRYSNTDRPESDSLTGAASQEARPTFQPTPPNTNANGNSRVTPPSKHLSPPFSPTTTEAEEYDDLDIRMKDSAEDPVYKFIKRFDPDSPDSLKTAMSASEIRNINRQLPAGHDVSNEDERTPRRNKNSGNNFNSVNTQGKGVTDPTRFDSVNQKPTPTPFEEGSTSPFENEVNGVKTPAKILVPPKRDQTTHQTTTMGPPIYYEWKWAVPAFDLEPPKLSNVTSNASQNPQPTKSKRPFSDVTRPTAQTVKVTEPNTEYNTSSYFVPDYIFPLDKEHPGYDDDNAQTSFQVNVSRPGRASYGENPACPQCHPAYLKSGTCEPCIIKR